MSDEIEPVQGPALPEPRGLAVVAPDRWFSSRIGNTFSLRIYSPVGMAPDRLLAIAGDIPPSQVAVVIPWVAGIMRPEGLTLGAFNYFVSVQDSGVMMVTLEARDIDIPKSVYWYIAGPSPSDIWTHSREDVEGTLDRVAALYLMHCGSNLLYEPVFKGQVTADTGLTSYVSRSFKTPQPCDGPFIHPSNLTRTREIAEYIDRLPSDQRARILLALDLFHRAKDSTMPFFEYWTALEVLCNGTYQRIRSRIQRCYELPDAASADEATGFAVITKWRHNLFHRGVVPNVSFDCERYIQLLFLDLLRFQIGLPGLRFLAAIQRASGYDLTPLGLTGPEGT